MNSTKRSAARTRGLALAARIATVGGITAFALGVVEVRSASASASANANASDDTAQDTASGDDTKSLPMEGAVIRSGSCGCSPCWGPPAPPSKSDMASAARGVA